MIQVKSIALVALTAAAFGAAALGGAVVAAQVDAGAREELAAPLAQAPRDTQPQILDARAIDLGKAFPSNPAAAGQIFRARKISLPPGARTEELSGAARPAIYYVTAGEVVERRNNAPPARRALHSAGVAVSNMPLVIENASSAPAEILLVDISPQQ